LTLPPIYRVSDGELPLDEIERALQSGCLMIFPTDTLYGLGGRARDREAARRTREATGRAGFSPLPVVAADVDQIDDLCPGWRARAGALAADFWPGPLTLVLPADAGLPEEVTCGSATLAVRVPDREVTRRLCRRLGPLVATSANRSGEPPPPTCALAVAAVGDAVVLAVDDGPGFAQPSTVVTLAEARPRLIRAGAIEWDRVRERLG
jgi:L-threonylcarbamoyladenylate synthase